MHACSSGNNTPWPSLNPCVGTRNRTGSQDTAQRRLREAARGRRGLSAFNNRGHMPQFLPRSLTPYASRMPQSVQTCRAAKMLCPYTYNRRVETGVRGVGPAEDDGRTTEERGICGEQIGHASSVSGRWEIVGRRIAAVCGWNAEGGRRRGGG